jgi:hypothetical protein
MARSIGHLGRTARLVVATSLATPFFAAPLQTALGQVAPSLGRAGAFAALAGSRVTCTDSVLNGDLGTLNRGEAVSETNCTVAGTTHAADVGAGVAFDGFLGAYDALALAQCSEVLAGSLSGATLGPGVYCFDASAKLTGLLTLDGPTDGAWVFKIGTSGTGSLTGANLSVAMSGGGRACNVFWWVAEAATLMATDLQGTLLTGAATTFDGGSLTGRTLAKATVALTSVTVSICNPGTPAFDCDDYAVGGGPLVLPSDAEGASGVARGGGSRARPPRLGHMDSGCEGHQSAVTMGQGGRVRGVLDAAARRSDGVVGTDGGIGYIHQIDPAEVGRLDDVTFGPGSSSGHGTSSPVVGNTRLHKEYRPVDRPTVKQRRGDAGSAEVP